MKIILAILLLTLAGRAAIAAEIDYSKLVFPQDARDLIANTMRDFQDVNSTPIGMT